MEIFILLKLIFYPTSPIHYSLDVQTMAGFKNVLFGGEGLFVTTLTGPGTVWLQGMPPDRMISEIARRMPSGGGIGLGIPIGLGGSSGGGEDGGAVVDGIGDGSASTDSDGGSEAEDLVASTDGAIEADRNATVASSGFSQTPGDSESSSALFGDAVPASASHAQEGNEEMDTNAGFSDFSDTQFSDDSSNSSIPSLDDSTSFSTEDTGFGDDLSSEQFDEFGQDETTFSTEGDGDTGGSDDGQSVISTLWDFFFHNDD